MALTAKELQKLNAEHTAAVAREIDAHREAARMLRDVDPDGAAKQDALAALLGQQAGQG